MELCSGDSQLLDKKYLGIEVFCNMGRFYLLFSKSKCLGAGMLCLGRHTLYPLEFLCKVTGLTGCSSQQMFVFSTCSLVQLEVYRQHIHLNFSSYNWEFGLFPFNLVLVCLFLQFQCVVWFCLYFKVLENRVLQAVLCLELFSMMLCAFFIFLIQTSDSRCLDSLMLGITTRTVTQIRLRW